MALQWKCVVSNTFATGPFRDNPIYPANEYYYNNANIIWSVLTQYGWTLNAICGAMGVFDWESGGFNPGIGELGGYPLPTGSAGNWNEHSHPSGLGFIQWTAPNGYYPVYSTVDPNPLLALANKYNKDWYDPSFQLLALNNCDNTEYTNFYAPSTGRVDILWGWRVNDSAITRWADYKVSTLSPEILARIFLANVEGVPGDNLAWRQQKAREWYNTFYGRTPDPDVPISPDMAGNIQGFVNWCIEKCNEPNIGYSQQYREEQTVGGITYYDCSSFVWYGLKHNDFDIDATGHPTYAFDTLAMPTDLPKMGFIQVDRNGELLPGDIGVNQTHTEVVYEGGTGQAKFMGAHSANYPLDQQVSINNYITQGTFYDSIWRFTGSPTPEPPPVPTQDKKMPVWMYLKRLPF